MRRLINQKTLLIKNINWEEHQTNCQRDSPKEAYQKMKAVSQEPEEGQQAKDSVKNHEMKQKTQNKLEHKHQKQDADQEQAGVAEVAEEDENQQEVQQGAQTQQETEEQAL